MIVELDAESPVPPYAQLRDQVSSAITGGTIEPGERLPTVRQLARDLGVAPGTVQRAYRELEELGLVEAQGRRGTSVLPRDRWSSAPDPDGALAEAAARFAHDARLLGVDVETATAAVRAALG